MALLRFGPQASQLIIEKGRRNLCHYETGYGSVTLGVTADGIECGLSPKGGSARFSYLLDGDRHHPHQPQLPGSFGNPYQLSSFCLF